MPKHNSRVINIILGLYVGLPWLAPVFMQVGWSGAGNALYLIYSTQCHQLPQRSFFRAGFWVGSQKAEAPINMGLCPAGFADGG
jgi:hypothetical protein